MSPEKLIDPEEVRPVSPLTTPVPEMSQTLELITTLSLPFPRLVKPLVVRVVKEAVLGVVLPIVPGVAQVPPSKDDALIVPDPVKSSEAPVPTNIAAVVFVPLVRSENRDDPPAPQVCHSKSPTVDS